MVEYRDADENGLNETLSALSDPTRRMIMASLAKCEQRVTELAAPFDISLNGVSKHVKKLEQAGLVRRRRVGREHYLSVDPAPMNDAARWFEEQRRFWNPRLNRLEALLTEEAEDE